MDASAIDQWLQRRFRRDANIWVALSPLAILGGLLVLFLTFWFAYAAAYLAAKAVDAVVSIFNGSHFEIRHITRLWLAGGFLVALVIGFLRTKPFYFRKSSGLEYFSSLEEQDAVYAQAREIAATVRARGRRSTFLMASSRMLTHILFTGPRLLLGGWGLLRESARLRTADTAELAQILTVLAGREGGAGHAELVALCPNLNFVRVLQSVQSLPGVVPLELGLSLTAELRSELRALG